MMHFLIQVGLAAIGVFALMLIARIIVPTAVRVMILPFKAYGAFWDRVAQMGRNAEWNAALKKLDTPKTDDAKFIAAMRSGDVVEVRVL